MSSRMIHYLDTILFNIPLGLSIFVFAMASVMDLSRVEAYFSSTFNKEEISQERAQKKEQEREVVYLPYVPERLREESIHWLALNLYHEARGESEEGMVAVGFVTLNRVIDKDFPNTVKKVVQDGGEGLYGCQFSWWCDGRSDEVKDLAAWEQTKAVAMALIDGTKYSDVTKKAVFYYNPDKVAKTPCWGKATQYISATILGHIYIRKMPWLEMKQLCQRT